MTCEDEGITVVLQIYSPLLTAGTKLAIVTLLWKTPLLIARVLETVILEELLSCPLGLNHVVATISLLLTVDGRLTVQKSVIMLSLMKRPVLIDTSTLGRGTIIGYKIVLECIYACNIAHQYLK